MENIGGRGDVFAPPFLAANPDSPVLAPTTPLQAQRPPKFGFGEEGKISFQPDGSDWILSAAVRFGRSNNFRHVDHQTKGLHYEYKYGHKLQQASGGNILTQADFADTQSHHRERHLLLDFSVGKDVGLGMLGKDATSVVNFGVRFAQFTSKSAFDIRARPDLSVKYLPSATAPTRVPILHFHTYHATGNASRGFHGVGPSLSWSGSAPVAGNLEDGEIMIDWGANAAILFGKQRTRVRHHETAHFKSTFLKYYQTAYPPASGGHSDTRSVTVPNVGGFAGVSWRSPNFKVSMGYRTDIFFGAMDTGIDAAKKANATFNGPYASISIGLGN